MKTVRFELPHGTELHTLDELSRASTVANQIQSALVIRTATWNYIYQDLIIDTHVDTKGKSLLVTMPEDMFAQFRFSWEHPDYNYQIVRNPH